MKLEAIEATISPEELLTLLTKNCNIPVISAGGVGCKADMDQMISYGAAGVSVGSPFIASVEANVTNEYKQACVDYGARRYCNDTAHFWYTMYCYKHTLCSKNWN